MPNKESRMTDADFATIKAMFAENDDALKLMRKIFLPELSDANPIGMNFDLWTKLDLSGLSQEQKIIKVEAHQLLVSHVEACLQMLRTIAGWKEETPEQTKRRLIKDSTK